MYFLESDLGDFSALPDEVCFGTQILKKALLNFWGTDLALYPEFFDSHGYVQSDDVLFHIQENVYVWWSMEMVNMNSFDWMDLSSSQAAV